MDANSDLSIILDPGYVHSGITAAGVILLHTFCEVNPERPLNYEPVAAIMQNEL